MVNHDVQQQGQIKVEFTTDTLLRTILGVRGKGQITQCYLVPRHLQHLISTLSEFE